MNDRASMSELHRTLTEALDMADRLELPMVAIHIDEARSLLAPQDVVATL